MLHLHLWWYYSLWTPWTVWYVYTTSIVTPTPPPPLPYHDFDDSNYATVEHDDHYDKWSNLANHHDHTQDQYDNGANQYHEGLVDQNHQEPIYSVTKSHNDGDNCDHAKLGELVHTPIASAPSSSLLFENRLFSPQSNAHRCPQPNLTVLKEYFFKEKKQWWQWCDVMTMIILMIPFRNDSKADCSRCLTRP